MTGDRPSADRPSADRPSADRPGADRPGADRPGADRPASGIELVNAWVMDPLARDVAAGGDRAIFDTMNRLLVGFGWLGNPLFLLGLTVIAGLEVRDRRLHLPAWLAWVGLIFVGLSWLRGVGSATGLYGLEVFIYANVPAFLWLAWYGRRLALVAREVMSTL